MRYYDKLIFELSHPGRTGYSLPALQQFPFFAEKCSSGEAADAAGIPNNLLRKTPLDLPEVSEVDVVR